MRPVVIVALGTFFLAGAVEAQTWTAPSSVGTFPIVVHLAEDDTGVVMSDAEVAAAVADATLAFRAAGVCFSLHEIVRTTSPAELVDERARRALRSEVETGAIHVFVVARILDPHPSDTTRRAAGWIGREPTGLISGAHIPVTGRMPGTYVVASASGVTGRRTLTHELGHVFGASHSADETNIMSYGAERLGFDDAQLRRFYRSARRLARRRGWLTDVRGTTCEAG